METSLPLQPFRFAEIWNDSIIDPEREPVSRDYLWASQVTKPAIDTWLAMRGTKPSNAPTMRAKRKFQAGNFFEHFVSMVMMRAGVMVEKQDVIWTDFGIRVKGKGDFVLCGKFDFEKAEHDIKAMMLPSSMERMFLAISEKMKEKYLGVEFAETAAEVKSVAESVMTRIEKALKPYPSHILQTCHYKLGRNLPYGVVEVICRDDLRLHEYYVTPQDEQDYKDRVKVLADILARDEKPPLAPLVIFDEVMGKFSKNINVEYSNFLSLLYGYERPDQYADEMRPKIDRWNRVLKRIQLVNNGTRTKPSKNFPQGKLMELTDKNEAAIKEMENEGWNPEALSMIADIEEEGEE